jgi:outer membrane receptor protein involved in Fe transport
MAIRTLAAALAASTCIVAMATPAQAQVRDFDIPAGNLKIALDAYSRQAGKPIIYRGEEVGNAYSRGFKGKATPHAALEALLRRSGFRAGADNSGAVAVYRSGNGQGGVEPARALEDGEIVAEEIVVTAQKREERLADVPQSVSVVTAAVLEQRAANQLLDFVDKIPGVSITTLGAGQTQVVIRGITVGADLGPTVGIYLDDVPVGGTNAFSNAADIAFDAALFDIDRVELLRGPQGTLYGASTMGGLLKYASKAPNPSDFDGQARAELSSTRSGSANYSAASAINIPLGDKLAMRASAYYSRDGGYIDNATLGARNVNSSDIYGGRLDLGFQASETLEIRLTAFAQDIKRDGSIAADYTFAGRPVSGRLSQNRQFNEFFNSKLRLASGTLALDLGPATITSITSYQHINTDYILDITAAYAAFGLPYSAFGYLNSKPFDKFTQEVRLASNGDTRFRWLVGGFYTNEDVGNEQSFVLRDLAGQPAANTLYQLSAPTRYREYAAFGNATYQLVDNLDVSLGVRYAKNEQRYESTSLFAVATPRRSSEGVVTYLANAIYKFSPTTSLYVRYATGYRPGGPNYDISDFAGNPVPAAPFEADRIKSYEAGFRGATDNGGLSVELSAFHIDWSDIQITRFVNNFSVIGNAGGGATVDGGELVLTARPSRNLTVSGAFAYQDARLNQAESALGGARHERLPNVPRFTASVNVDHEMRQLASRPSFGATLRHVSDRTTGFGTCGVVQYCLPDHVMVDLRSSIAVGPVTVRAFVKNLFDVRAQLAQKYGFASANLAGVATAQPRTIGLGLSARF